MEQALRSGQQLVEDVRFPLFHETDPASAQNIISNGIGIIEVDSRNCRKFGRAFCLGVTLEDTIGRGNQSGATVKFIPWKGTPPRWLNIDIADIRRDFFSLFHTYSSDGNHYSLRVMATELSASSIRSGTTVYLGDYFEQYIPTEIISTPRNTTLIVDQ